MKCFNLMKKSCLRILISTFFFIKKLSNETYLSTSLAICSRNNTHCVAAIYALVVCRVYEYREIYKCM